MENTRTSDRNLETVAWGALFIWWGITELVPGLPHGTGAIGIGLIFLGLNLARSLNGIPTSGFSTTLGILALVLGGAGTGKLGHASVVRTAHLCDLADRAGRDLAGA
jgi:hypothetical protein